MEKDKLKIWSFVYKQNKLIFAAGRAAVQSAQLFWRHWNDYLVFVLYLNLASAELVMIICDTIKFMVINFLEMS